MLPSPFHECSSEIGLGALRDVSLKQAHEIATSFEKTLRKLRIDHSECFLDVAKKLVISVEHFCFL
ncbi:hypothetical protein GGR08_000495 [Bartonella fuyuanensis]|uniref:Uncharacterized protein n=1 Tax=Bartonella fuyuanensis TaxID=1460968 RepID=A0A840DXF3_9HYPH|nr:hypothetical protein [Bartonella fuyuanensis]